MSRRALGIVVTSVVLACSSSEGASDAALSTCRHPGDCGTAIGKCPWQP